MPPRCICLWYWFDFVEFVHDITALIHVKSAQVASRNVHVYIMFISEVKMYLFFTITEGKYNSLTQWNTACSWWKGELIDNPSGLQFFERLKSTYYYGQFALSLGKESPYILFKLHPLNTNMLLIWNFSLAFSGSILRFILRGLTSHLHQKFVCIFIWQEISNQRKWSAAPSASGSCLFIADRYQRISLRVIRDLSEISRGGGGIINLGSEMRWSIPAMGVKFVNPPLELGLKYHDPPPLV